MKVYIYICICILYIYNIYMYSQTRGENGIQHPYEVLASYLGCMCLLLIYFPTMLTETCFRLVCICAKKSTYTVTIKYSLCPTMYKTTVWNFPNKRLGNMILHWAWESRKLLTILCMKIIIRERRAKTVANYVYMHFKRMFDNY